MAIPKAVDRFIDMPAQHSVSEHRPQGEIILCGGVPWDNSYTNVRYFASAADAKKTIMRYFQVLTVDNFVNVKNGIIDVRLNKDQLSYMNCNYLIYTPDKSKESSNVHFFFITNVIPLSWNSCRLEIEEDIFQTNIYKLRFEPCFVERQLVPPSDDVIGRHTFPEKLETGPIVQNSETPAKAYAYRIPEKNSMQTVDYSVIFLCTFNEQGKFSGAENRGGVVNGLTTFQFAASDLTGINNFLTSITENGLSDGILTAYMFPTDFYNGNSYTEKTFTVDKIRNKLCTYVPKNKKLFCYPYNYLIADNNTGTQIEYRYELFTTNDGKDTDKCTFTYGAGCDIEPTLVAFPLYYANTAKNLGQSIVYKNFAKVALSIDTFKAWIAQSGTNVALEHFGNFFGWDSGTVDTAKQVMGFLGGIVKGGVSGAFNCVAQTSKNIFAAPTCIGTGGGQINLKMGVEGITFYQVCITEEYARIIDNYFSRFGYAINRVQMPNLQARNLWTYVKTQDCVLKNMSGVASKDGVEAGVLRRLCDIFNNGVTVWNTTEHFGDQSESAFANGAFVSNGAVD